MTPPSSDPAADAVLRAMRRAPANTNIKWDCPSDGCYRDHLPDWTPFNDCFPRTGIRISDIDGMVEIGGHFLFLEWKPARVPVPEGQLNALARLSVLPRVTVLILWGTDTLHPEQWQVIHQGELHPAHPVDHDTLHAFIAAWATTADAEAHPASRCVPARPGQGGRTGENRVPNCVPVPLRDAGDAGRATAETTPTTTPSGTRFGTRS